MQYFSTRDSELRVSAQEAIVRGLAPQSGLFVPEAFPKADLEDWKNLSYPELAEKVLAGFLTDRPLLYIPGILVFFAGILLEFVLIRCPFCHRYVALYAPGTCCPHCGGELE